MHPKDAIVLAHLLTYLLIYIIVSYILLKCSNNAMSVKMLVGGVGLTAMICLILVFIPDKNLAEKVKNGSYLEN